MRAPAFLALLVSSCIAVPALAANSSPQAGDWLNRLALAERQHSYHGSFIYESNGTFSSHDIWHRVDNGSISERLVRLDGEVQEVVRVDGRVTCASSDLNPGVNASPDTSAPLLDPLKLMGWYDLRVIGESRVAGRDAVTIGASPRDQHRYGFELAVDRETGLPLRSLMLNDKGQLLERFEVIRLDTNPAPSTRALQPGATCKPLTSKPARARVQSAWRADWLPAGFELVGNSVQPSAVSSGQVSKLMYDDGLARFTVFLESIESGDGTDTRTQIGPTAAVARHLQTADGAVMVSVVGEIPVGTAERVALSMRRQDAAGRR